MNNEKLFTTDLDGRGLLCYRTVATPDPQGQVWSMAVIKLLCDGETESSFIYDIARDAASANRIAELFCRHTVTPCTAGEVMEDLLAQA